MANIPRKRFPGKCTIKRKTHRKLVGDSYQADPDDLKKLRQLSKRVGVPKAELIRYGVKLVLMVDTAKKRGGRDITMVIHLEGKKKR